jgi:Tfp pilus assembly protein PilX
MKSQSHPKLPVTNRRSERGAALLTMLLVSILLLSAGLALVTATSLSTTNAIDSTAEMQAYAGAEAGLEATLHVLRGNVAPDASLGTTRMNFRNAANPATANKTSDPWATGTAATSRLSGWLNYSYQNPASATDWRVPLTANYAPTTGIAFKVTISDPDDPGPITTRQITTNANYQPTRLIIQSEGFGPKGAVKRLEMIIQRSAFEYDPPAPIYLPGGPGVNFNLGNSSEVEFSGNDIGSPPQPALPTIAVPAGNLPAVQAVIDGLDEDQVAPNTAGSVTDANTPSIVKTADAARQFLNEMRALADDSNRLFNTKAEADAAGGLGTPTSPRLTFIDNYNGDPVTLGPNHQGSGLLVVTGNLITKGTTDFQGIIFVLGRGIMTRDGGGEGLLRGAILVAPFDPYDANNEVIGPPTFLVDGGGNSTIAFDSVWVRRALDVSGFRVLGVREYH